VDLPQETEQGKALFQELLWVHGAIRRDLETVRELSAEVAGGLPAEQARERIEELKTGGPLWQLKVNCLRYCRFVHMHHNAEDTLFFPRLREADPDLAPVVDKLEADHRVVSDLLDEVEASAAVLDQDEGEAEARRRLVVALETLADALLTHLDYEEASAGPTIRSLTAHPFG
jgi:hypothetical protein